jgi:peptide/nickel transport system substrate-binding protein
VEADIYQKMLHEIDPLKQRVLMRAYERQIVDVEAHEYPMLGWNRIMAYRSEVKGWKIGPSHYINQNLATIWLEK